MTEHSAKRQKVTHDYDHLLGNPAAVFDAPGFFNAPEFLWDNMPFLDADPHVSQGFDFGHDAETEAPVQQRSKRRVEDAELETDDEEQVSAMQQIGYDRPGVAVPASNEAWHELFPELFAQSPSPANRKMVDVLPNPFTLGSSPLATRYDQSKRASKKPPTDGQVNGYVKFTFHPMKPREPSQDMPIIRFSQQERTIHHRNPPAMPDSTFREIPRSPSNLGSECRLDRMDRQILQFYELAYCSGRTLLAGSNAYLDFMTMTDAHEGIRHCALALAAGYVLDYMPNNEKLQTRANAHYQRAIELLSHSLADPSIREVGKELETVGSLVLLISDDTVNWELRKERDTDPRNPRWRQAARVAKKILDCTSPGFQYSEVENTQISKLRMANANVVAKIDICALPVTQLEIEDSSKLYTWLLEGNDKDVRKIDGFSGVSPKMLHMIAQITQLTARLEKDPDSMIIPLAAEEIENRLDAFKQWSELSEGFDNVQQLLESCVLDERGLVNDAATVTDLTAETWVQAARIYLFCRFHRYFNTNNTEISLTVSADSLGRLPRYHNKVQHSLSLLLRCLERMPTGGELFTAQSPFFCIFVATLVAYKAEDRQVLRSWFEDILAPGRPRSSVPPIWRVVKEYWVWIDQQPFVNGAKDPCDAASVKKKEPWWEKVVERFMEVEGQLALI